MAAAASANPGKSPFYRLYLRGQGRTHAVRCHLVALRKAAQQVGTRSDGVPLRDTIQILEEEIQEAVREIRSIVEQLACLRELDREQVTDRAKLDTEFKAVMADYHRLARNGGSSHWMDLPPIPASPRVGLPNTGCSELTDIASVHGRTRSQSDDVFIPDVPVITIQTEVGEPVIQPDHALPNPSHPGNPSVGVPNPAMTYLSTPVTPQSRRKRRRSRRFSFQRSVSSDTISIDSDADFLDSMNSITSERSHLLPWERSVECGSSVTVGDGVSVAESEAEKKSSLRTFCGIILAAVTLAAVLGMIVIFLSGRWKT